MSKRLLALLGAIALSCGNAGAKTAAACKSLLPAVSCGGKKLLEESECDGYASSGCDLSDYFTCLRDHYVCLDGGTYDTSKLSTAGDCVARAKCN